MTTLTQRTIAKGRRALFGWVLLVPVILSACGGGGGSTSVTPPGGGGGTPPPPVAISKAFKTPESTQQFLSHATFGARQSDIDGLTGTEVSTWMLTEFNKQPTNYRPRVTTLVDALPRGEMLFANSLTNLYFDEAIAGNDQLRQRMVLALSEIVVLSSFGTLDDYPEAMAYYVDILSDNAFGNYRDILEQITYSPAMGFYLSYMVNEKGDMETGRVPDENYARELMQLFSIGLIELNLDGTPKTDGQGQTIETYTNADITGLAKVFTGLSVQGSEFYDTFADCTNRDRCPQFHNPMVMFDDFHSPLEKQFLDVTILPNTAGAASIDQALDEIFNHPNVAPFVSRQLIQRFVTSSPKPAYVRRVAVVFESGRYALPNGTSVGTGQRGDLKAVLAAILFDDNALRAPADAPDDFGKVREPMIRFINWARAFGETTPDTADEYYLEDATFGLGQHPFRPKSVFNFYRPGFVAPGTETGAAGLTAPELQIVNESTAISYINFMNAFIYNFSPTISDEEAGGVNGNYTVQVGLADNAQNLINNLDLLLTGGQLSSETKTRMTEIMNEVPIGVSTAAEDRLTRVLIAISMVMTTPEYLVQR